MNNEIVVTRIMICRALMKYARMSKSEAWVFSEDLDYSIEYDYLPVSSWKERYRLVIKDCLEYVEGMK